MQVCTLTTAAASESNASTARCLAASLAAALTAVSPAGGEEDLDEEDDDEDDELDRLALAFAFRDGRAAAQWLSALRFLGAMQEVPGVALSCTVHA